MPKQAPSSSSRRNWVSGHDSHIGREGDRPQIELVLRHEIRSQCFARSSKIHNVRPIKGQDGRLTVYPSLRDRLFSARPALGLRALAHGAPPLDKVIIFQE